MLRPYFIMIAAVLAWSACGVKMGGPMGPIGGSSDATFEDATSDPLSRIPMECKEGEVMDNGWCVTPPSRCLATEVYLAYLDQCVPNTPENTCFSKGQVLLGGDCVQNAYYGVCILKSGRTPGQDNTIARLKTEVADNSCEGSYQKLAALKKLDISKIEMDVDLRVIADFTQLEEFISEYNLLTSVIGVEKLKNLKKLNLSDNKITSVKGLESLSGIENLDLEDNKITDISPLSALKKLKETDLSDNDISSLSPLQGLTDLEKLDLNKNGDVSDLRPLSGLRKLKSLRIEDTDVGSLAPLVNLPLTTLDISGSRIADFVPSQVSESICPVFDAVSQVLSDTCYVLMGGI